MGNLFTKEVGNLLTRIMGNVLTAILGKVLDIYRAGMVLIELQYHDAKGDSLLGKTRIMNATRAFLSGTGLAGIPEPQGGSPTCHVHEVGSDWHKNFEINIKKEIKDYLPKVDLENVKRICLILDIAGSDDGCGGEAYVDNLSLYYEK